eukprot:NODE_7088_length_588_cov_24.467532_g6089_i0.p1 GENE.NODE_7088_length_588_cov_24.467532_g6089_i0~~NODE_7088_length_588_cov_24.467532_g6089_i0.p1  ORF type:complete len:139 (-),score=39.55 NODE_7088_length_588_cov_24.467532_g6089_i0:101-517(-)
MAASMMLSVFLVLCLAGVHASESWSDTPITTELWQRIRTGDISGLKKMYAVDPNVINHRSGDGRGALFWAYEFGQTKIIALLEKSGVDTTAACSDGRTASEMAPSGFKYQPSSEDLAETWEDPDAEDDEDEDDEDDEE